MQFITQLAGHQFAKAEAKSALAEVRMGTPYTLSLKRDPENAYDPNAIQVRLTLEGNTESYMIGHVSAQDGTAAALAPYLDNDKDKRDNFGNPLWTEDHVPTVDRCEILDWVSGDKKPTIVIEVSTGFELGTIVNGDDDDEDSLAEPLPGDEEDDDEAGED